MQTAAERPIPFKVFGLQRTGTNLIQALMSENFSVSYLTEAATGWKHGPPAPVCFGAQGIPTRFILCVKNPYAWLVSCYRYFQRSHGRDQTMPRDFRRDPRMPFEEFVLNQSYEFPSPVHRWNFMYRCWLVALPAEYTAIVRQEDQVLDQAESLRAIERQLQLVRRGGELRITEQQIDVNVSARGPIDRDPYLLRTYMSEYSSTLLRHVNRTLDRGLMELFGYSRERWALGKRVIGGADLTIRACSSDGKHVSRDATDPNQLKAIQRRVPALAAIIDIGAGIGSTVVFASRLWPACRILAYEARSENFRLLRINTQQLKQVTASLATIGAPSESSRETASASQPAPISLDDACRELDHVDLLRIGTSRCLHAVLKSAPDRVAEIPWIVGKLPADAADRDNVLSLLRRTHHVTEHAAAGGQHFVAEKLANAASTIPPSQEV